MKPIIHVPVINVISRIQSSCDTLDDTFNSTDGRSTQNSLVLSGLDEGSPLSLSPRYHNPPSIHRAVGSGRSSNSTAITPTTSKVDLFGEPTLPSPLMKLRMLALVNNERPLLERRKERTPPPTKRQELSRSYSTEDEIIGEIITDLVVPEIFGDGGYDSERSGLRYDRGPSHWFTMSDTDDDSFVATTTGASVGKLTPHSATTPQSARSDANALFGRQRSNFRGSGLFDSQELSSSSAREMVALDVPSLAPQRHSS